MKIFNTQAKEKQEFIPLHEGKVGIYSCGPTVYDYFHIGNARPFVVFDTLRRYLMFRGYEVTFVQNFTDIDDKMINRANKEGITVKELGERFIKEYFVDADGLNIMRASVHPKATENISEIIEIIQRLIDKGLAYETDGDVYYRVEGFEEYGKLSGQHLDELNLGSRIEVDDIKENPMDFALWKAQKPGEPAWESPWGMGRPGWHIECSAMSMKYLGDTIDIHCGGHDLTFPHHENEIAQSEGATGHPFVRYWMHNGYININGEKMSKSLGNFFTVRDISKEFELPVVRMFMLSSHYRSPINFSKELLMQTKAAYDRLKTCYKMLDDIKDSGKGDNKLEELLQKARDGFITAMEDDLNTADALGVIFETVREINTFFIDNKDGADEAKKVLSELCGVLGLKLDIEEDVPKQVIDLCEQRVMAKKNKDFVKSDALRDQIKELGYTVKDTRDGYSLVKD